MTTVAPPAAAELNRGLRWPLGLAGRNGVIHPWYGIGQSLLLLLADIAASIAAGAENSRMKAALGIYVPTDARRDSRRRILVSRITWL